MAVDGKMLLLLVLTPPLAGLNSDWHTRGWHVGADPLQLPSEAQWKHKGKDVSTNRVGGGGY